MEDKKLMIQLIEMIGDVLDKVDKIESQLGTLTKKSEYLERTTQILAKRKILTKKQILGELGISGRSWRGWSELVSSLEENPKINVHKGFGRAETIIIHLNDYDSTISMASRLFKSLNKKGDYNFGNICKMFDIDNDKAKQVLGEAKKIFGERLQVGAGVFKRRY